MSGPRFLARVLPAEEWDRLARTDFPQILPYVSREALQVVVVEEGDEIVACWGLMPMLHLEGLWVDPRYRGHAPASLARQLLATTWREIRSRGVAWVMTAATDAHIRRLLERHVGAIRVPGESYLIPVYGEQRCQFLR